MKIEDLDALLRRHAGEFHCVLIRDKARTRVVPFAHVLTAPVEPTDLPPVGRLGEFYATIGSLVLYQDAQSGDAARYLAPPSEWAEMHERFSGWLEILDEDEREELLPDWMETCLAIGETPRSGNYILVATQGPEAGHVFEFDHDGFEINEYGSDVVDYVARLLQPDGARLVDIASHMRFIEDDPMVQWWIQELRDNHGHVASTD